MKFDPNPQSTKAAKKSQPHSGDVELPSERPAGQETAINLSPIPVNLELSLTTWRSGYLPRQLNMARIHTTRISQQQAVALKLLAASLSQQGMRLSEKDRHVQNSADALKWILDRIVEQIPDDVMQTLIL